MQQLITDFEQHLSIERNLSAHTLRAYRQDLEEFQSFLQQDSTTALRVTEVDTLILRRYLACLHRKNSRSTIARKLSALRPSVGLAASIGHRRYPNLDRHS